MELIKDIANHLRYLDEGLTPSKKKKEGVSSKKNDSIEISNTSKAFQKVDDFLNLGKPDRLDISNLNPAEKKEFLKMLSTLLKDGVVGYEILDVNGKPEKHYIVTEIGDHRIAKAKLYKKDGFYDKKD
ncbi:MAG: hypothetical protein WCJ01_00895 [Ignavibacteria bacterium]